MNTLVIVLNERYFVRPQDGQPVGASSFVSSVAESLTAVGDSVYFVLMRHDTSREEPQILLKNCGSQNTVTISYNFDMDIASMQSAFTKVRNYISVASKSGQPWFWYQSIVFAKFHPNDWSASVTCHAPFAAEVERMLGRHMTIEAFQGGVSKLNFLKQEQSNGLDALRGNDKLWSWEFSRLQAETLQRLGIPERRVVSIPSHLLGEGVAKSVSPSDSFHNASILLPRRTIFTSAAARNDGFKALDDLVLAHKNLILAGKKCDLQIYVGAKNDEDARAKLVSKLSPQQTNFVLVQPRLEQGLLLDKFRFLSRKRAVFVFPSLYETYGLTAVQAGLCGMPVLLRGDKSRIGCLHDLVDPLTFIGDHKKLFSKMYDLLERDDIQSTSVRQGSSITSEIRKVLTEV